MKSFSALTQLSHELSMSLFKVMIPIILIMKLLEEMGLITLLSALLEPIMILIGLPGEMGLVWATAMLTNLYGGIVVFAHLFPQLEMTVAQVTIISSMMLIAHALPVETGIASKAGVKAWVTLGLRVGMAFIFALLFSQIYFWGDWLQQPATLLWQPQYQDPSLLKWFQDQVIGLIIIYFIVLSLVIFLDILKRLKVIEFINRGLRPLMHFLGIGRAAETITVVGLTLGITYGGAMLIKEAKAGHVPAKDILFSISLLGLCHSIIEDTLLMVVIGADLSGILFGRVIFSLAVIYFMVKIVNRFSESAIEKYFVNKVT